MSLVTLAEAASFVENEDSKNEPNTRGKSSKSPVTSATSDSDSEKSKKRPGGAGTREIHNRLEKNRRAQLKVCFETLKNEIPTLEDKRTSNLNILKSALRYIQFHNEIKSCEEFAEFPQAMSFRKLQTKNLEKKTGDFEKEREDLKKRNIGLRERLRVLRKEIKLLLDVNSRNGIKTDGTLPPIAPEQLQENVVMVSPVPIATQNVLFTKKARVPETSISDDEEIDVTES